jgi:ribosomal protein S18 acetylase RimI-like enzyme
MMTAEIDNPFWTSLQSRHRGIAQCAGGAARFPSEYAPFLGVMDAGIDAGDTLRTLVGPGESVYLLGIAPEFPREWGLRAYRPLAQMIRETPIAVGDDAAIVRLSESHRADVLALTALVYPHYFRARTMELGRYFGIYVGGRLAAIAGERLATETFQEVSAICTHPDFLGRGYAYRLTAMLTNDILATGRIPYLHVSYENARAKDLYERMGYRLRRDISFWSLTR